MVQKMSQLSYMSRTSKCRHVLCKHAYGRKLAYLLGIIYHLYDKVWYTAKTMNKQRSNSRPLNIEVLRRGNFLIKKSC